MSRYQAACEGHCAAARTDDSTLGRARMCAGVRRWDSTRAWLVRWMVHVQVSQRGLIDVRATRVLDADAASRDRSSKGRAEWTLQ